MRPCFFIVGAPRSGTTLLRRMLDAHPRVAVTPESHFGARYVRKVRRFGAPGTADTREALLDDFCASRAFERSKISKQVFRDAARRQPEDPWAPLRVWLEAFAEQQGAAIVGEKTPSHALFLPELARVFPEARFILLRRDPRAVVASWGRVGWSKRSEVEAAEIWRRYSKAMRKARRWLGDRTLELRYEALISSPETQLTRVCELLGVPFEPSMLEFHERLRAEESERLRARQSRTLEPVDTSRVEAWRSELEATTLRRVEAICGYEMSRAGYPRESGGYARLLMTLRTCPTLWRKRVIRRLASRRALVALDE